MGKFSLTVPAKNIKTTAFTTQQDNNILNWVTSRNIPVPMRAYGCKYKFIV